MTPPPDGRPVTKPALSVGSRNGGFGYAGTPLFQLKAGAKPLVLGNEALAERPSVPVPLRAPARPPTAPRREYMIP